MEGRELSERIELEGSAAGDPERKEKKKKTKNVSLPNLSSFATIRGRTY